MKPPGWWWKRHALSLTSPANSGSARLRSVTGSGSTGKSSGVLREGASVSEKYQFIDAGYAGISAAGADPAPTITCMCKWLGVSKSGFYDWRSRPESPTARRREPLKIKIKALFEANDSTYGYRRMHAALVRGGEQAGPELVRQLMRELGLVACQPRPWRPSTTQQGTAGVHSRGAGEVASADGGKCGSQGLPAMALAMVSSAVMPWAAAESR